MVVHPASSEFWTSSESICGNEGMMVDERIRVEVGRGKDKMNGFSCVCRLEVIPVVDIGQC
jgi:hypothetical protein